MRIVIQRVSHARVIIDKNVKAAIGAGLLLFAGWEDADGAEDLSWMSNKIVSLRVFDDVDGVPNLSVKETGGDILIVSQFTLHAATRKGNRPSYIKAAKPTLAKPLYEAFISRLQADLGKSIFTGEFGADMQVELLNDGPITIWIDSRQRD